jgi:alanine racemase
MRKLLNWLSRRRFPYTPLITILISEKNILHNLREFQKYAPHRVIAPVLKSNAYGHGLLEVARIIEKDIRQDPNKQNTIPFLIVDSYFEAVALRAAGIKSSLLIIGYTRPETIQQSRLRHVSFTVTSLDVLRDIQWSRRRIDIHLKIDTGMHRQGIMSDEVSSAIDILHQSPNINLQGICTHLSDSDGNNPAYTRTQISRWNTIASQFKKEFPLLTWIHVSATYGHPFSAEIDANISRLGLGLYGLSEPTARMKELQLQPVMEMKTIITSVKTLKKGESIGYNNTFTAPHDMRVATIPVGYYEGIDRHLSNRGYVLVGSDRTACRIVGRVSMNITSIDVSHMNVHINDEVVVISSHTKDPNSISSNVTLSEGTIPYEMVVRIPAHLKRVVV